MTWINFFIALTHSMLLHNNSEHAKECTLCTDLKIIMQKTCYDSAEHWREEITFKSNAKIRRKWDISN